MKFPMDAQQVINQFEKENGESTEQGTLDLLSIAVKVLNKTYESSKSGERSSLFPINKDKIPEVVGLIFNEYPTDSENKAELKDWFNYFIDLGNDAYKQGQIDGYNKALDTAVINSKLA